MTSGNKITIEVLCDKGTVFAFCALIFFLPISIALVDSFAGLAIFFYGLKKFHRIISTWEDHASRLNLSKKILFIAKGISPQESILNRPIEILTIAVFISVLHSQFFWLSLFAFFGKFGKGLLLYFSFRENFINEKRIRLFLSVFLASVFLTLLSGFVQKFGGWDFVRGRVFSGGRISSCFGQTNTFAAFLLIPLGIVSHLLYAFWSKNKSFLVKLTLLISFILLIACLCWTYSRAAWIGYLFSLFFMAVIDRRKIFYAVILFVIFLFLFPSSLNNARHVSLLKDRADISLSNIEKENSNPSNSPNLLSKIERTSSNYKELVVLNVNGLGGSGRYLYWKSALVLIQKEPLWGNGLNTYARDLKRYALPHWYAHNCYLQMAAEIGLVGLACFLWLLFVLYYKSYVMVNRLINYSWLTALFEGTLVGILGLLVNSFFDNSLYTVQLGVLFWVILGFAVAVLHLNSSQGTFSKQ